MHKTTDKSSDSSDIITTLLRELSASNKSYALPRYMVHLQMELFIINRVVEYGIELVERVYEPRPDYPFMGVFA